MRNNSLINLNSFDEQIQLIEDDSFKDLLGYIGYRLKVGNKQYEGTLDNNGKTERFITNKIEEITDIEFFFNEISYFYELDEGN